MLSHDPFHVGKDAQTPMWGQNIGGGASLIKTKSPSVNAVTIGNSSALKPSVGGTTLPILRLTVEEMKDKRDKWLCYNCDKKMVDEPSLSKSVPTPNGNR